MRKLFGPFRYIFLFLLLLGCNEDCSGRPANSQTLEYPRTLSQGDYVIINLNISPSSWTSTEFTPPEHAQMYQFDADTDQNTYVFFYRADSSYIGEDLSYIKFVVKDDNYIAGEINIYHCHILITVTE